MRSRRRGKLIQYLPSNYFEGHRRWRVDEVERKEQYEENVNSSEALQRHTNPHTHTHTYKCVSVRKTSYWKLLPPGEQRECILRQSSNDAMRLLVWAHTQMEAKYKYMLKQMHEVCMCVGAHKPLTTYKQLLQIVMANEIIRGLHFQGKTPLRVYMQHIARHHWSWKVLRLFISSLDCMPQMLRKQN